MIYIIQLKVFLQKSATTSLRMRRSLVKMLDLVKTVTKMVTGCLRMMKVAIVALGDKKVVFSEL